MMSTVFLSFLDPTRTKKIEYHDSVKIDVGEPVTPDAKRRIVDHSIMMNQYLAIREIFQKRRWDITDFDHPNRPVIIDSLVSKSKFSRRDSKELWALDLPIKMPGKGWAVPADLAQFSEFIEKADKFEQVINPEYDSCYAYLCVDQREVAPGQSQRRPGYHADSFITPSTHGKTQKALHDSIYVASDCISTVFNPGPFPFNDLTIASDPEHALTHFNDTAYLARDFTLENYHIVKMDPTVVHRVGINSSQKRVPRTFAKLVYSTEIFNREGNDVNLLFDYNWPMFSRQMEGRNTSSVHTNLINGHPAESYEYFNTWELVSMFDSKQFTAIKNGCVTAYPATPGELLQTVVKGSVTTQNRARVDDWKITTYLGDQYFIPFGSLQRFYQHIGTDALESDYNFVSNPDRVTAVEIDRLIKFKAPWGSIQYLMPGDYLVKRNDQTYGVKKESFESNYAPS